MSIHSKIVTLAQIIEAMHHDHAMGRDDEPHFTQVAESLHRTLWARFCLNRGRRAYGRSFIKYLQSIFPAELADSIWHAGVNTRLAYPCHDGNDVRVMLLQTQSPSPVHVVWPASHF